MPWGLAWDNHDPHVVQWSAMRVAAILSAALVGLVLAARALALAPLTLLANAWRPPHSRIGLRQWAVIWWAGSMRGAGEGPAQAACSIRHVNISMPTAPEDGW
jgi:NhaP-type Na+/H+ or K+/H+ antiporter